MVLDRFGQIDLTQQCCREKWHEGGGTEVMILYLTFDKKAARWEPSREQYSRTTGLERDLALDLQSARRSIGTKERAEDAGGSSYGSNN